MTEQRIQQRNRTFRSGKLVFNNKRSIINCVVKNLSISGACLEVESTGGIPTAFELKLDEADASHLCQLVWMSDKRVGVEFRDAGAARHDNREINVDAAACERAADGAKPPELLRSGVLSLRAGLDEVPVGIVLLDSDTRAEFMNRAFRRMWRLPDSVASNRPPFVALMYHGRDTLAYGVAPEDLDAYIAARVAHVKAGDPTPLDVRLASGEVIRVQCTALPSGGRMLCYTYVTDIVRHSDELDLLRNALDQMQAGVILLDEYLNAQFLNRAVRKLWQIPDEVAELKPSFVELVGNGHKNGTYGVANGQIKEFMAKRIAAVRAGDPTPIDILHGDGRVIRSQCAALPNGGRMITYTEVTDLIERAQEFEQLARHDGVTGIANRREFDVLAAAEWDRFQRYQRPLSLLLVDVDRFKSINDCFGHEEGDKVLKCVATVLTDIKRSSDIVARIGGDEFAMLLPETDLAQANAVARRLHQAISQNDMLRSLIDGFTLSIGVSAATLSMSGFATFIKDADRAMYQAKAAGRNCTRVSEEAQPLEWPKAAE